MFIVSGCPDTLISRSPRSVNEGITHVEEIYDDKRTEAETCVHGVQPPLDRLLQYRCRLSNLNHSSEVLQRRQNGGRTTQLKNQFVAVLMETPLTRNVRGRISGGYSLHFDH
jgi:hypothetical protein